MINTLGEPSDSDDELLAAYQDVSNAHDACLKRIADDGKRIAALESENAKLRRQVELVAELADFALSDLDSLDELATKDRQARYSRWVEFETHEIDTGCYAVSWKIKDHNAEAK